MVLPSLLLKTCAWRGLDHKFGHHINVIPAKAGIQKEVPGFQAILGALDEPSRE